MITTDIKKLDRNFNTQTVAERGLVWRAVGSAGIKIHGLHWFDENGGSYHRFPRRAAKDLRPALWELSRCPAGAYAEFWTDSKTVAIDAETADAVDMQHMAATGSRGLALYHQSARSRWYPAATAVPTAGSPVIRSTLLDGLDGTPRRYRLYFPLYKELLSLRIGLTETAVLQNRDGVTERKPAVFYGTSITQGGCASTAGTDYVSLIGRQLDIPVLNFGFSGNAQGDPAVARLLGEIPAAVFVLDYSANADVCTLAGTLPGFIDELEKQQPQAHILLVTPLCHGKMTLSGAMLRYYEDKRDVIFSEYVRRRERKCYNIHIADGFALTEFGSDAAFVDGIHPTDHGFSVIAGRLGRYLRMLDEWYGTE